MANVIRKIGAGTNVLSPNDLFIEIDNVTSGDTVDIYLPNTKLLFNDNQIYSYVGIRLSSLTAEKGVTVNLIAQDGELIDGVAVSGLDTLNTYKGIMILLTGQGKWRTI